MAHGIITRGKSFGRCATLGPFSTAILDYQRIPEGIMGWKVYGMMEISENIRESQLVQTRRQGFDGAAPLRKSYSQIDGRDFSSSIC